MHVLNPNLSTDNKIMSKNMENVNETIQAYLRPFVGMEDEIVRNEDEEIDPVTGFEKGYPYK